MSNKNHKKSYWNWVNNPTGGMNLWGFSKLHSDTRRLLSDLERSRVEEEETFRLQKIAQRQSNKLFNEYEQLVKNNADPAEINKKRADYLNSLIVKPKKTKSAISLEFKAIIDLFSEYAILFLLRTIGTALLYVVLIIFLIWLIF